MPSGTLGPLRLCQALIPLMRRSPAGRIVWLATLPEGAPSGLFFRDRQPIPW